MQNVQLHEAFSDSKFSCIYSTSVLQGFLSLDDLAEIAVKVITDPKQHSLARYGLVGENVSHDEVAAIISEQLGKSVKPVLVPREQAVEGYAKRKGLASLSEKDDLERMLFYYDKRRVCLNILNPRTTCSPNLITAAAYPETPTSAGGCWAGSRPLGRSMSGES
jgi:nucleoside-diphosphate-sugar epimerase